MKGKSCRRDSLSREVDIFLKSKDYDMRIIKKITFFEYQGEQLRLYIIIRPYYIRLYNMDNSG